MMMDNHLSRREALSGLAALGTVALLPGRSLAAAARPPNILFIMADDLGYADVGCYGRTDYQTPHIDRIAADGIRFTDSYANSPVCSATRTALLTGRYQYRLPVGLEEPLGAAPLGVPASHPTVASLLRQAGYDTSLFGKWHLGRLPDYGPLQSGYDHFWGLRAGGIDYFSGRSIGGQPDLWDGDQPTTGGGYLTEILADRTIATIERCAAEAKPFFISLHFTAPHWPWQGPNDQAESERIAKTQGGAALFDYEGGSMATYAAMVTSMDTQIGRVLATLDRLGLKDDTIVVFTSDNGGERYSNTWPLSGKKTTLLEGGLRVPTVIRWPARIPAGRVSGQVVMSMDWMPTFVSLSGGRHDPAYPPDGIDLTPWLTGNAPEQQRTVFWRYFNMGQEACREGQWKYLKIRDNTFLFDLAADPLERANLKNRQPEIFARLAGKYRDWNAGMLPLHSEISSSHSTGAQVAEFYGVTEGRMPPAVEP